MGPRDIVSVLEDDDGPLERGALALARDAYPSLDVGAYVERLDALAEEVITLVDRNATVLEQIAAMRTVLYVRHGLRGNREDYYDPRNSYLNDVLDRKRGIPISLSVVALATARRAGIVAEGIAFPGHFLVRFGGPAGILTDPFDMLRVLDKSDLDHLAKRALGAKRKVAASHLEAATPRTILVRMLMNLRAIHEQRKDHRAALVVCDRLVELGAGPPALRDRGFHALALGARAAAREDLARYLAATPNASDRNEVERAIARAQAAPDWN